MIDQELREMFTEREALAPDTERVAGAIGMRIRRRQARGRVTRVVAVAAAVIGVTVGVAAWATGRTDVSPAPSISPPPTSTASGPLVTAEDPQLKIPVRPTWLPPDLTSPRIFTNAQDSLLSNRSIIYEGDINRRDPGTQSVTILTDAGAPVDDGPVNKPSGVIESDTATVDVNGHAAQRYRMTSTSVGNRGCTITWQQRPDLRIMVEVSERSRDATLNCDSGIRVARGVVEQPQDLKRTVRLTRVPAGFTLVQTGTNLERWCPQGAAAGASCVETQSIGDYGEALGDGVTVHGHGGNLDRHDGGFTLVVLGWIRMESLQSDLTDAEILEMAGAAVLEGGW